MTLAKEPLAHSAREIGTEPQTYAAHIAGTSSSEGVITGAGRRAEAMLRYHFDAAQRETIKNAVVDAATFHDLGKLDPDNQAALRQGRKGKLRWDHIDAGVAHLRACGAYMAAWIVRAHHAPGLPSLPIHFAGKQSRRLRGQRYDTIVPEEHKRQIERTNALLGEMVAAHEVAVGPHQPIRGKALHGLALRLSLSCLVDADHSDTAYADTGWKSPDEPQPRWAERLAALDAYVASLSKGEGQRDELRREFYDACRHREPDEALLACEGPVGIGKTTAVTAYLLQRAIATGARRLLIVAPFTAILSQTAKRLREALVLDDECDRPDMIVAEHHHRADFANISSRDLATLWTAPIVLTTAVQFFETLAANTPSALRKLHALPGSVVFLDEAHAALPVSGRRYLPSRKGESDERVETPILPQNWRWICQLADEWSCSFVLASGSLARFWMIDDIVGRSARTIPELTPPGLATRLHKFESTRVRYRSLGRLSGPKALANAVLHAPGPRLLIMNTVQSAAVMARHLKEQGRDVLHISTALCPRDRDEALKTIGSRLSRNSGYPPDWTLVATSLMEAGVDLSFRSPFRERGATASLIQIGGRGNRNHEWPEGVVVYDFLVDHMDGLKEHPAMREAANVLGDLFVEGKLEGEIDTAGIVTQAMWRQMRRQGKLLVDHLGKAEQNSIYPDVASLGRVIDTDTRLVVVDRTLRDRVVARDRVTTREILAGSVQIWSNKIRQLGLEDLPGRDEVFWWPHAYDPSFLGYMEGALYLQSVSAGETLIV